MQSIVDKSDGHDFSAENYIKWCSKLHNVFQKLLNKDRIRHCSNMSAEKKGEDYQSISWSGGGRHFFFLVIVPRHAWLRLRGNSFIGRNGCGTLEKAPRMARVNLFASTVSETPCHGPTDVPAAIRSERTREYTGEACCPSCPGP